MDLEKKIAELGKAVAEASKSEPSQGAPIATSGNTTINFIMGDNNHIGPPPQVVASVDYITPAQRGKLRGIVDDIVAAEQRTKPEFRAFTVWQKLNKTMGVTTYKDIPKADCDRAINYLQGWLRNICRSSQ